MNEFEKIYKYNVWVFGSGSGSLPFNNKPYLEYLQGFLDTHGEITSVLDIGCGDWQISKNIDWTGKNYLGVDVAKNVLTTTQKKYTTENIRFKVLNVLKDEIPSADLIIVKDVLQHLSNDHIKQLVRRVDTAGYKYLLVVNDECKLPFNFDIKDGKYRPLNVSVRPFKNGDFVEVLSYYTVLTGISVLILVGLLLLLVFRAYHGKHKSVYVLLCVILVSITFCMSTRKSVYLKEGYGV